MPEGLGCSSISLLCLRGPYRRKAAVLQLQVDHWRIKKSAARYSVQNKVDPLGFGINYGSISFGQVSGYIVFCILLIGGASPPI